MDGLLKALDRGLTAIESVTDTLAAAAIFLTMAIVCGEVIARYFLNAPLAWAFDVLTLYIVPAIFFFGLPGSYSKSAHIAVDVLVQKLRPLPVALTILIGRLGGIALFAALVWFSGEFALENFRNGDTHTGVIVFLVWPSSMLVPLGCALVLVRMLSQIPTDIRSVLDGGPPAGTTLHKRSYVE